MMDSQLARRAFQRGREQAAADIEAFHDRCERNVRQHGSEQSRDRNEAVLGAYLRAAEIARGEPYPIKEDR